MICDFCSSPAVRWRYPAESFIAAVSADPPRIHASEADWAACDDCSRLIEADDRRGLAARSYRSPYANPEFRALRARADPEALLRALLALHAQFFHARLGPRSVRVNDQPQPRDEGNPWTS